VLSPDACAAAEGTYQGDGTSCSPNPCPQYGACCFAGGGCSSETFADCFNFGGLYQGNGTVCSPNPCPTQSCCNNNPTGAKCWMRSGLTPTLTVSGSASFVGAICAVQQSNPTGPTQEFAATPATITTTSTPDSFSILSSIRCKFEAETEKTENSAIVPIPAAGDPVIVPSGCPHNFTLWIGALVVQNDSFPSGKVDYFICAAGGSNGTGGCSANLGFTCYSNSIALPGCLGTFDLPIPSTLAGSGSCQSGSAHFTATLSYVRITISTGFQSCQVPSSSRSAEAGRLTKEASRFTERDSIVRRTTEDEPDYAYRSDARVHGPRGGDYQGGRGHAPRPGARSAPATAPRVARGRPQLRELFGVVGGAVLRRRGDALHTRGLRAGLRREREVSSRLRQDRLPVDP